VFERAGFNGAQLVYKAGLGVSCEAVEKERRILRRGEF